MRVEATQAQEIALAGPSELVIWWPHAEFLVTLAGIVIAALIVVWQMGRQHRNSLKLQQENKRAELRASIYAMLLDRMNLAGKAEVETSTYVRMLPYSLRLYRDQFKMGVDPKPVKERAAELLRLHGELHKSVSCLIKIFESYAIALPGFEVFQDALNSAGHDLRKTFMTLHQEAVRRLPMELNVRTYIATGSIGETELPMHIPPPLTEQEFEKLERLVDSYLNAVHCVGSYVHDLRVEGQNFLLSDLYPDQRVPCRVPLDPNQKVVTVKNADELRAYFRDETAWGKEGKKTDNEVRRKFAEQQNEQNPKGASK